MVAVAPGQHEKNPFEDLTPESSELISFLKELIGDTTIDVEVKRVDPWTLRESAAESYSRDGRVFILGDAAHRHTPAYGQGGNACVQDAYNLAWKIAYVSRGLAGPGLLNTYNDERQPVGANIVKVATSGFKEHINLLQSLGMVAESAEAGSKQLQELSETSEAGTARRAKLHDALKAKIVTGESLGLSMNEWHVSAAIYLDDESEPRPKLDGNPIVDIQISTYPGTRLPHAWLTKRISGGGKQISTHDLAGHGAFCLLTGHGGNAWKQATEKIAKAKSLPINAYDVGFSLDYHDVYGDWREKRGIEEGGCVLVRPDRFVAWRSLDMVSDCEDKLLSVLCRILSWN